MSQHHGHNCYNLYYSTIIYLKQYFNACKCCKDLYQSNIHHQSKTHLPFQVGLEVVCKRFQGRLGLVVCRHQAIRVDRRRVAQDVESWGETNRKLWFLQCHHYSTALPPVDLAITSHTQSAAFGKDLRF